MGKIFKIAARNLLRYQRRTILTTLLITLGVVSMLLFVSTTGSFKNMMVGQITDSMLGHFQIHKKGYVSSIDSLPLTMNMKPQMFNKVDELFTQRKDIEAWSPRIKFGVMFSNFAETTSMRVNGVDPEHEAATSPELMKRLISGEAGLLVERGKILIPELIARGLKVKTGDAVVLVATNKDGSVNGINFTVKGVLEGLSGPGGRDGYMHIEDAKELLRMDELEVSEIAVRLKDPQMLDEILMDLKKTLGTLTNQQGKPVFEIHSWDKLSPFTNIAKMIDLMTLFIKISRFIQLYLSRTMETIPTRYVITSLVLFRSRIMLTTSGCNGTSFDRPSLTAIQDIRFRPNVFGRRLAGNRHIHLKR